MFLKNEVYRQVRFYVHDGQKSVKLEVRPISESSPSLELVNEFDEPAGMFLFLLEFSLNFLFFCLCYY